MSNSAIINGDLIEISFDFDWALVQAVKEIPGRKWNKSTKVWTIPATPYHCQKVIESLEPNGFWIGNDIRECADPQASFPKVKLPDGLYGYQKDGVRFIYAAGGRCIVGDDCGLGKTIQALTAVDLFMGRTLIVVPQSVLWKWKNEADKWTSKTSDVIEHGKSELTDADIHIMTYGIMALKKDELSGYDCVIFDESHRLKSYKAKRTKAAQKIIKSANHVLFLTATPVLNRPHELYTTLNMIDPKSWGNWAEYMVRYCGAMKVDGHWFIPPDGAANLDELSERLKHVMIRRTKQEALDLPELTRSYVPVDISNEEEYKQAKQGVRKWMEDNRDGLKYANVLVKMNVLRQVAGKGKVAPAVELAEEILDSGQKVVLFAHHREVVASLAELLKKYNVGIISGDTPAKKRQELVENFLNGNLISKTEINVMIITIAGAEGIDLFTASNIIFVEREWTPAMEEQAEGRLHRNGQTNKVTAYYLTARHTIDDRMINTLDRKRDIIEQIVSSPKIASEWIESL